MSNRKNKSQNVTWRQVKQTIKLFNSINLFRNRSLSSPNPRAHLHAFYRGESALEA